MSRLDARTSLKRQVLDDTNDPSESPEGGAGAVTATLSITVEKASTGPSPRVQQDRRWIFLYRKTVGVEMCQR